MVQELLEDRDPSEPLELDAGRAMALLGPFGLRQAEGPQGEAVPVAIRHDPLFGPLIEITGPGGDKAVRITPLTERDVAEILENIGIPQEAGLGETLGRLSQMIEELPWLWSFEGRAVLGDGAALEGAVSLTLKTPGSKERRTG